MQLKIKFWNKVEVSTLTIELIEGKKTGNLFLRLYTNDVNIFNKKLELDEANVMKEKMDTIFDMAEEINTLYLNEQYDEFKKLSNKLMDTIKNL